MLTNSNKNKFVLLLEDEKGVKAIGPYTSHKLASSDKLWLTKRKVYKSIKVLTLIHYKELYETFERDISIP